MTELTIFTSTFAAVFFLGVQSLNVNGGHHAAAAITSFGIGLSHLVLYKTVPDAGLTQSLAYLLGGPCGIVCAMWSHRRIRKWWTRHDGVISGDAAIERMAQQWREPPRRGEPGDRA